MSVTIVYCGLATLVILIVLNVLFKFRASSDEEIIGMDLSQHRERAYALGGGEAMSAAAAILAEPRGQRPTSTGPSFRSHARWRSANVDR